MAPTIDLNRPDSAREFAGELATASNALARQLKETRISDRASLEQAVTDRQTLGDRIKFVKDKIAPVKSSAHRTWKMLCDLEAEILAPLVRLDTEKKNAIAVYVAEEEQARAARERVLAEEQRRADQDQAAHVAADYEQRGDPEMAAAILEEAIAAPPPVVVLPNEAKSVEGLHLRRRYLWRFSGGPKELEATPPAILARVMQLIPRQFLCVDDKKISAFARSMKGSGTIPGIEFYHVDEPTR
jgi:hypothetical protein